MTNPFRLSASPTPAIAEFDFDFASEHEMKAYIKYESDFTHSELSALGEMLTESERDVAKQALAKKRKAVYKMWKARNQPSLNERA